MSISNGKKSFIYKDSAYLDWDTKVWIEGTTLRFNSAKKSRSDYVLSAVPDDVAKKNGLDHEFDVKPIKVWEIKLRDTVEKLKKDRDSSMFDLLNDPNVNNVRVPVNNATSFSHFIDDSNNDMG